MKREKNENGIESRSRAILSSLSLPLALGACLSWLEPSPDETPSAPAVASSDRGALFRAAVAAFSDGEAGFVVGDMDPVEGWFQMSRIEEWRTGDEAIDVDVRLEPSSGGSEHVVVAVATRRTLLRSDDARGEPVDVSRRFRDAGVERDVLERIRASAERFRVPRSPG